MLCENNWVGIIWSDFFKTKSTSNNKLSLIKELLLTMIEFWEHQDHEQLGVISRQNVWVCQVKTRKDKVKIISVQYKLIQILITLKITSDKFSGNILLKIM